MQLLAMNGSYMWGTMESTRYTRSNTITRDPTSTPISPRNITTAAAILSKTTPSTVVYHATRCELDLVPELECGTTFDLQYLYEARRNRPRLSLDVGVPLWRKLALMRTLG